MKHSAKNMKFYCSIRCDYRQECFKTKQSWELLRKKRKKKNTPKNLTSYGYRKHLNVMRSWINNCSMRMRRIEKKAMQIGKKALLILRFIDQKRSERVKFKTGNVVERINELRLLADDDSDSCPPMSSYINDKTN